MCNGYSMCAGDLAGPGMYVLSTHGMSNMYHLFVHIVCGQC